MAVPPATAADWTAHDLVALVAARADWIRHRAEGVPPAAVDPSPIEDRTTTLLADLGLPGDASAPRLRSALRVRLGVDDLLEADPSRLAAPDARWLAAAAEELLDLHAAFGRACAEARGDEVLGGRVVGVFVGGGGLPKHPVNGVVEVRRRGLDGDRQRNRRHHGRVWQAVCLWSAEVIARLVGEGHSLFPGAAGENLTLAGLDWSAVRPGRRVDLGDGGLQLELTAWADPCRHQRRWFVDGDYSCIAHDRRPGASRIYARVLRSGPVGPGDGVSLH